MSIVAEAARAAQTNSERIAFRLLSAAALFVLAHAFVPLDEFVHRTDDAFYYFKTAYNYPATGFWSFDSIHSTNGVQPLWAWLLTAIAQAMAWLGLRDPDLFARTVVGVTGLFHVAACLLLFRLLTREVSLGVGTAVTAAFLLPMGIVWQHVFGMENSMYAFFLVATASYYQFGFRGRETSIRAVALGLLFGLTALARLNAVLFAICGVAAYVLVGDRARLAVRIKYGAIIAAVSAACVLPYLAGNYVSTGHPLPISGAVKAMLTERFLQVNGLDTPFSLSFVKLVLRRYDGPLTAFLTSRVADCTAILGGRVLLGDNEAVLLWLLATVSLLPLLFGARQWLAALGPAMAALRPLWFVALYAAINFATSVFLYPHQISNAMVKWWLVDSEIVILVLVGTVVGTAVAFVAGQLLPTTLRPRLLGAGLALLVALHGQQMVRFYWDGEFDQRAWNLSWNDESLRAARWLSANVGGEAVVGSWNAGVLGYYARQRVTNLDGLINNFELLPYLRDSNVGEYIEKNDIAYLSDMESIFASYGMRERLRLEEVYRHHNALMREAYVIYRVVR